MSRSSLFARAACTRTFTSAITGERVTIRKLTTGETAALHRDYLTHPGREHDALRFVVSRAVVKPDGSRVFTDQDAAALLNVEIDVVAELAAEIATFSGLIVRPPPSLDASPTAATGPTPTHCSTS